MSLQEDHAYVVHHISHWCLSPIPSGLDIYLYIIIILEGRVNGISLSPYLIRFQ